jgi:tetratricopeptide (TPR) repeat protein
LNTDFLFRTTTSRSIIGNQFLMAMKIRIFTTCLFLAFLISHHIDAQRLIRKMAGDACDCITDLATSRSNANPNELMEQCLELVLSKYEKKLRREYGDEFFNSSNTQQSEDLGLQIAKQLVSDCPNFLDLIVEDESASGNNAEGLFERGNELFNQGRHQEAIDKYSEALKLEPENHSYYNSRGVVYFDQGKYYYAISDFINAIRWKSNFALGFYNLAYSKYYLNDVHAAHEDINTSLLYDDGYCDAYNLEGLIYNQLEKPDSALLSFRSALECDATRGLYAFNIGYVQYSQQNYADAIANFRKAIEFGYEDSNVFSYLGNSYNGEELYDEALKAHKDYISRNSDDYVGYYNLGLVYQNKGEYQNAVEAFEKALEKEI